ncbi:MAG: RNA polymerase sigma factor [Solirubrobacteraceae bacterium]
MEHRQSDFAHVYRDHVWRIYGFVAYRVRDRQLAEDLTQATFERALRAWGRFDPRRASESTWLMAIARNLG